MAETSISVVKARLSFNASISLPGCAGCTESVLEQDVHHDQHDNQKQRCHDTTRAHEVSNTVATRTHQQRIHLVRRDQE